MNNNNYYKNRKSYGPLTTQSVSYIIIIIIISNSTAENLKAKREANKWTLEAQAAHFLQALFFTPFL